MGVRSGITALAATIDTDYLFILGIVASVFVLLWVRILFFRPRDRGSEAGGKIWWKMLRPIHTLNWLAFAVLAFWEQRECWYVALGDTVLGFVAWVHHHSTSVNP